MEEEKIFIEEDKVFEDEKIVETVIEEEGEVFVEEETEEGEDDASLSELIAEIDTEEDPVSGDGASGSVVMFKLTDSEEEYTLLVESFDYVNRTSTLKIRNPMEEIPLEIKVKNRESWQVIEGIELFSVIM